MKFGLCSSIQAGFSPADATRLAIIAISKPANGQQASCRRIFDLALVMLVRNPSRVSPTVQQTHVFSDSLVLLACDKRITDRANCEPNKPIRTFLNRRSTVPCPKACVGE